MVFFTMMKQRSLGDGELRLLRRLSLDPSLRQVEIARDLKISRCALNQSWRRLERLYNLRIMSDIDYGHYGIRLVFGWAQSKLGSKEIRKFNRWLSNNPLVIAIMESTVSSTMNSIIYFEAALPYGPKSSWFKAQLERFRKRPYSLNITTSDAKRVSTKLNPGHYDGSTWEFEDGFRFGASIEAARQYIEVFPSSKKIIYSLPTEETKLEDLVIASAVETNYHATASYISKLIEDKGIQSPSTRTIRRHLRKIRKYYAMPYLDIIGIGLEQLMIICIKEQSPDERLSKFLEAQVSTYPQSRFLSGESLSVLHLRFPKEVDWFKISEMLSHQLRTITEIFTFIATDLKRKNGLDSVIHSI